MSSRFMLMTATTPAIEGVIIDHREQNPSPLLRKIRRRQKQIELDRIRLEKEMTIRKNQQARERAEALGYEHHSREEKEEKKENNISRRKKSERDRSSGSSSGSSSGGGAGKRQEEKDGKERKTSNIEGKQQQNKTHFRKKASLGATKDKKRRKQRPASAGPTRGGALSSRTKGKHMEDPKLMKPQAPKDRGHMSRPATALPFRANVSPKRFIAPSSSGGSGSINTRAEGMNHGESSTLDSSAGNNSGTTANGPSGSKRSVKFATSVEGGTSLRTNKSNKNNKNNRNNDTLNRAANVQLSNSNKSDKTNTFNGSLMIRPDGLKSSFGHRTTNDKVDLRWKHRRVVASRVIHEVIEEPKPFSAWTNKYKELTKGDKAFGERPVSGVAASGPYISQYKFERLEYMKSKQKWVGEKQFRRHFGKASQTIGKRQGGGVVSGGNFKDPSDEFRDPDDRSKFMNPIRGWRRY